MRMYTLANVLANAPPGVYRLVGEHATTAVPALCHAKHIELLRASGGRVRSKKRCLAVLARAFGLPGWFGMNWDALADSLTDCAWPPRSTHVLLLSRFRAFAKHAPLDFAAACAVLEDAASFWAEHSVRFFVLIEANDLPRSVRLPAVYLR